MRAIEDFDILILPGWRGSGPEHWQTHWQAAFPAMRRVEQTDWERPVYADWARNLSAAVNSSRKPVVLVAHSLANALVARWSQDADTHAIAGAFMVATSDINRFAGTPEFTVYGFDPLVLKALPFPAVVLSSRDDERVAPERARQFAASWGARFVDVGERGHVGSAANLGLWPQGLVLFGQFIAALDAP
jgi:uncharacterized protein